MTLSLTEEETTSIPETSDQATIIQSLTEENEFLKQEIEKKNAIIMEQLRVIQDLASQITNTIYVEQSNTIHFVGTSDQATIIQSLTEENEFLKQEIEKKNAIIMEQLRVIQDLASQITNTLFYAKLNNFSLA